MLDVGRLLLSAWQRTHISNYESFFFRTSINLIGFDGDLNLADSRTAAAARAAIRSFHDQPNGLSSQAKWITYRFSSSIAYKVDSIEHVFVLAQHSRRIGVKQKIVQTGEPSEY